MDAISVWKKTEISFLFPVFLMDCFDLEWFFLQLEAKREKKYQTGGFFDAN